MLTKNLKSFFANKAPNVDTAVYTVPVTNKESVIKEIIINNTDPSDTVTFTMKIGLTVIVTQNIAAGDTLFSEKEWFTVINPGDSINILASKVNAVDVRISGVETVSVADN